MISKLINYINIGSLEKKLDLLKSIDSDLANLNIELDEMATDYTTRNEAVKSFQKSLSFENFKTVLERHNEFEKSHIESVKECRSKMSTLEKEKESILKSVKISAAYNDLVTSEKIKKSYKDGLLKPEGYNAFLKAKEGVVKYADTLVFNEDGELLICKKLASDYDQPNMWVIPGGHVDLGEKFNKAAKRELQEETGLIVDRCKYVGEYKKKDIHIRYYKSEINQLDHPITLESSEMQDYKWVSLSDLDKYEFPYDMKDNIKKVTGYIEEEPVILKSDLEIIVKAVQQGKLGLEVFDLIKARYADNATNRRLKRVGQEYGTKKQDEGKTTENKKEDKNEPKKHSPEELTEKAKNTSAGKLEAAIKESGDPEVRQAAHNELQRREKEEKPQEEKFGEPEKKEKPDPPKPRSNNTQSKIEKTIEGWL